jgi:hypothetical protein
MRDDMKKIICEQGRASDPSAGATARQGRRVKSKRSKMDRRVFVSSNLHGEWEENERRMTREKQPMGMHSKQFTDFLAPLEGWVAKQVGRPFAKVHAELRAQLKGNSTTQQHVLQHFNDFLIPPDRVRIVDGIPYEANDRCAGLTPISQGEVYVDPRDGLLKWGKEPGGGFLKKFNPKAQQRCYRKLPRHDGAEIALPENWFSGKGGKIYRKGGKWYHQFTRSIHVAPSDPRPAVQTIRVTLGTLYKEVEEVVEVLASRRLLKRLGFRPEKKRRT